MWDAIPYRTSDHMNAYSETREMGKAEKRRGDVPLFVDRDDDILIRLISFIDHALFPALHIPDEQRYGDGYFSIISTRREESVHGGFEERCEWEGGMDGVCGDEEVV